MGRTSILTTGSGGRRVYIDEGDVLRGCPVPNRGESTNVVSEATTRTEPTEEKVKWGDDVSLPFKILRLGRSLPLPVPYTPCIHSSVKLVPLPKFHISLPLFDLSVPQNFRSVFIPNEHVILSSSVVTK